MRPEAVSVVGVHAAGAADEHHDQPRGVQPERGQRTRDVGRLLDPDGRARPPGFEANLQRHAHPRLPAAAFPAKSLAPERLVDDCFLGDGGVVVGMPSERVQSSAGSVR
jgi:hypothetical protein